MPPPGRWCSSARSSNSGPPDISSSTSSPILVGDTIYVVAEKGDLCAVDANTGAIKWKLKLGIEQRNSCPLFADGKLYVPILDDPAEQSSRRGGSRHEGRLLHHQARREARAKCSAMPRWTAVASARRWPRMARFTSRPRATSIAGARRATTPVAPPLAGAEALARAGTGHAAPGHSLRSAAAPGREGHFPRAVAWTPTASRSRTPSPRKQ